MKNYSIFKSYKILFLCKWYPNRGNLCNGIFIKKHAEAIAKHAKVSVIYIGADDQMRNPMYEIENTIEGNLNVIRVYYKNSDFGNGIIGKSVKAFRYFKAFYTALKIYSKENGRPHVIHVNVLTRPAIAALILKKLKNIPYIITEHWTGYMAEHAEYSGLLKRISTQLTVKNAAAVTTVSEVLSKSMQTCGLKGNYITIPNIVEVQKIPFGKNSIPTAINVSDMVDEMKNISGIIKAMPEVIKEFPELRLELIGEGPDRQALEQLALNLNLLNKNVFFFNQLAHEQVLKRIAVASFLIVNSHYESFSVVAAEALACGTPVLSTQCGGPEEFINEDCGILIKPGDLNELIWGIKTMVLTCKNYTLENLQKKAGEKFSPSIVSSQFLELYQKYAVVWKVGNSEKKLIIDPLWTVLDVGSGNRPNERANVLLEKELGETIHRSGEVALIPEGKKLVQGDALAMPFEKDEFDFVIASHIAEHIEDPEKFCKELSRVGRMGYVETPGKLSELFFNEPFHKWIVYKKGDVLVFKEKTGFKCFSEFFYRFYYLNETRVGHKPLYSKSFFMILIVNLLRKSWKHLPATYTKYAWKGNIQYRIILK
ncbi:MAG: glycosyltransferase [Bacteroidetes bacterium]|nr:glycosyltransferase [Bacteroidota bacterium]HET6243566.1 glycosyltransferase [Bacteroidia bacterium]